MDCGRGILWPWTPGAGAPIIAAAGQRWHFVGDSITADLIKWFTRSIANGDPVANYFVDQLNALVGGAGVTVTSSGIAGDRAVWLASQVHERIAIFSPDVVVVLIGINDIRVGTSSAVIGAAYDSILYGVRAELPNAQILVVSMFLFGEQWLSGPLRWAPGSDNNISAGNTQIAASAATYGAAYADIRDSALLYEQANNTPEPGVDLGVLTWNVDNFHPGAPTGKVFMATQAMLQVST